MRIPHTRLVAVLIAGMMVGAAVDIVSAQGRARGRGKRSDTSRKASEYREITLPAGTPLHLALGSPVASETAKVEDRVLATLRTGISVDRLVVLPQGSEIVGYVTEVERSGRVKGRARVMLQFTTVRADGEQYEVRSEPIEIVADGSKAKDAAKIGVGTGAGAAIGAILGGGSGAATGAVLGGAAGTGTVLATRGEEVQLNRGEPLETRLATAMRVRVPIQ